MGKPQDCAKCEWLDVGPDKLAIYCKYYGDLIFSLGRESEEICCGSDGVYWSQCKWFTEIKEKAQLPALPDKFSCNPHQTGYLHEINWPIERVINSLIDFCTEVRKEINNGTVAPKI